MTKFEKARSNNVLRVLDALKDWVESQTSEGRREFCAVFNDFLDELLNEDAFGTEGQCDPRGDHR